jgi:hypothetical protein
MLQARGIIYDYNFLGSMSWGFRFSHSHSKRQEQCCSGIRDGNLGMGT